jgi:hypothetical protein
LKNDLKEGEITRTAELGADSQKAGTLDYEKEMLTNML